MQVSAAQIRRSVHAKYILWHGTVIVRVYQSTGIHGFHSAALVVKRLDDPLEVRTANWYDYAEVAKGKPVLPMLEWVAQQLTELSTGTHLNLGGSGVEGLKK